MKKISFTTPCYNEEDTICELYNRVTEVMKGFPQYEYDWVFIDNHSTDNTEKILRELASKDGRVKVILNMTNYGVSRSSAYGMYNTDGDCSIGIVADLQDPPELIPELIKEWENGAKVVWARKAGSNEKRIMKFFRKLYYKTVKAFAESEQYEDITGFGLFDKEVVDYMRASNDPSPNYRNMVSEYGYKPVFIDYIRPERTRGKSSYNFFKYVDVFINSVISTSIMPLRLATYLGFLFAFVSFLVGVFYLVLKLVFWDSFSMGLAPAVIGVFFVGSVQLVCIGILGEYIGQILKRQKNVPLVIEKERINFDK